MKLTRKQLMDFFIYYKNHGCYFPAGGYMLVEFDSESPIIILTMEDGVAEIVTDKDYIVKLVDDTDTIEVDLYKRLERLPS